MKVTLVGQGGSNYKERKIESVNRFVFLALELKEMTIEEAIAYRERQIARIEGEETNNG
jgi:hypothetical protein